MKKKQYYIKTEKADIPIEIEEKYLQDYIDDNLPFHCEIISDTIPFFPIKKLYSFEIRGKYHKWDFHVEASKKQERDWEMKGIDVLPVTNIIPEWWVYMGFSIKLWCFFQDLLNLNNPFAP